MQTYPDVIAQCVYSTFIHAFPTSWNNFDDEFKNELCNIVSLWQVGEEQDTLALVTVMLLKRITVHDPPTTVTGVADFRQTCMHMHVSGLQVHRWCLTPGRSGI